MALAERIKEVMGDMAPGEFAKACHVTPASVTFWTAGDTKSLRAEPVAWMELRFGYRASWIVTGKGPKKIAEQASALWRFSEDLQQVLVNLSDDAIATAENVLRAHLGLPQQSVTNVAKSSSSQSAVSVARQYAGATEDGEGALREAELPTPKRHARKSDRRPAHQKGGGGA
jgi:hypothetical protein